MQRWFAARALALLAVAALPQASCRHPPAKDTLRILLADDILTLDPNEQAESVTDSVLFNVFEPLVGFDEDLVVHEVLADSWEHPRPEQWRFHLRKGVRFQDGTPLTAALVREALEAVRTSPHLENSHFLGQVESTAVVDDLTFDIVTREPRAILSGLASVYVFKRNAAGSFPPLVGTGPYRLERWEHGREIVLSRNEGYWGRPPAFSTVYFEPLSDPRRRMNRLVEQTADIVYAVPPELATEHAGIRIDRRVGLTVYYLGFDVRDRPGNPFRDLRVRRAVHQAIDREAIVRQALLGVGTAASQPIAPFVFGFDPALTVPPPDPEGARRLLAEAGFPGGFRVRLDFPTSRLAPAQMIRRFLQRIGIEVELNGLEKEQFFELAKNGKSAFFFPGWDCSSGEAGEFFEFNLHTPAGEYGLGNYGSYSNPEVDRIAERNLTVLDPRERKKMLQRATAIVMADLPVSPLYALDDIYAARKEIQFKPRADREIRISDVRYVPR